MNESDLGALKCEHSRVFGKEAGVIAFAPGRVNFIGEHTDYNGGLVMPAALDLGVWVAASKITGPQLSIRSIDFNKRASYTIEKLQRDDSDSWANCPKGMVHVLRKKYGFSGGCEITITGNIPLGSGLSSSAACEVAVGKAVAALYGIELEPIQLALLAQEAEHRFTGTLCGIMDQAASALGRNNCLVRLDCSKLKWEYVPFTLTGAKLLIVHSGVKHNLADGEYNKRREECFQALSIVKNAGLPVGTLAECDPEWLDSNKALFPDVVYRRARHVVSEQQRVMNISIPLGNGDLRATGKLLTESHRSLQYDYEVSCPELDFLVDRVIEINGVYGARMTGGGFGGCMIILVESGMVDNIRNVVAEYQKAFGAKPAVFEAHPSDGARIIA